MIAQFTRFKALFDLQIGRRKFKVGDLCCVTSPKHNNIETVIISKVKGARLNEGVKISTEDLDKYFIQS